MNAKSAANTDDLCMLYLAHHMLQENAAHDASRECFIDHEQRLSYGQSVQAATGLAAKLREMGVQRGDRVAIFLEPSTFLPIAIFGVLIADAAFVPIHHGQFPEQVAHILNDCDAGVLITDTQRLSRISEITSQTPSLEGILVKGLDAAKEICDGEFSTPSCFDLETAFTCGNDNQTSQGVEKDLAAILYTSGSTGRPKGVMLSHANIIAGARIVSDYLQITQRDRLLAALPLSFDAGLNQLTTAVLQGGSTVMINFRFGRDIVQRLSTERITGLAGVPSLWNLLAQPSSGLGKKPLPDLRYITNTGGAMPVNVLEDLTRQLPQTEIFLMYGLTEAFRSTYLP
ncbi:MAG: AMP-binding protein, partial [Pirellulaceae bacterium]|nr:AMP-binding protein [Pirellulaceae bacterium]